MTTLQRNIHEAFDVSNLWNAAELLKPLETEYFNTVYEAYDEMVELLHHQPLGVIGLDANGCVGFCNPSAIRVLGLFSNPVGKYWASALPFSDWMKDEIRELMSRPGSETSRLYTRIDSATLGGRWIELELRTLKQPCDHVLLFLDDVGFAKTPREQAELPTHVPGFVGESPAMLSVYKQIEAVAAADCTVLIQGETGTGKELAARAIHALSARSGEGFLAVNCAGLSDSLWAGQLFGHARGSFTGATGESPGFFEAAGSGTLFLDEIGDMPLPIQMSLLRVLQEREVIRIGENTPRKVKARIIVATNRDLRQAVKARAFREDLFYRIQVARVQLPPLRERCGDLQPLIAHFLKRNGAAKAKGIVGIDAQVIRRLETHYWPGNIRELANMLEYSIIVCEKRVISLHDLPPEFFTHESSEVEVDQVPILDKGAVAHALERAGGSRVTAARLLGVSRATLYRRLKEFEVPPKVCSA
jgi:DNA-binding NtrC family response regulator